MLRIMWNSKSAMIANQEKLDAISNNISNINTDGYKKVNVSFKDLMQESLDRAGYPLSKNGKNNAPFTGTGVRASEWIRDDRQGSLTETNVSTDLAIDGEGLFRVTMPNGTKAYSRSGKFEVDSAGKVVDSSGNTLDISFNEGYNQDNVRFNKGNFSVSDNGEVTLKGTDTNTVVGRIPLYKSTGTDAFASVGNNLYIPQNGADVYESTNADIRQGFTENSNVDLASEMTDMIITQRAFELGSRGIKTADEMWGMANNLRSK